MKCSGTRVLTGFVKMFMDFVEVMEGDYLDKQEGQHPLTGQRAPPISGGT